MGPRICRNCVLWNLLLQNLGVAENTSDIFFLVRSIFFGNSLEIFSSGREAVIFLCFELVLSVKNCVKSGLGDFDYDSKGKPFSFAIQWGL